jgi:MFS family permease
MSGGLVLVLVAVSETATWHWLSAKTLACMLAGFVLLLLWVRSESRSEQPLVDMRMMRIRGVWTTNVVAFLLGFGMYASFILVPQFVETPSGHGYGFAATVTEAGLFLLPATAAMLVAGSQTGRLEKRFGSKPPLLAGGLFSFAAFALLAVAHSARWQIYVAMLLLGIGIGLAFAAMANLIIENVGPAETGVATGMNAVTRTVGGAFGGAAVASVLARTVSAGGGVPTEHAYVEAFVLCAVALLAGVVVGFAIPQRRPEAAFARHAVGDLDAAESEAT